MGTAFVNKILPMSAVDGPGNRVVVFLQGCNFDCSYCHNPETINHCHKCGQCVLACPQGALTLSDILHWNSSLCIDCGSCLAACQRDSSPKVVELSVEQVLAEIVKARPFISGLTVSGGECSLQADFLRELFCKTQKLGLTTFMDTNGHISRGQLEQLVPYLDKAMVDLKAFDSRSHKELTGQDNSVVIETIKYLATLGKLFEVRTVIVPGFLDNEQTVQETSRLIASYDPSIFYKLIPFRPNGVRAHRLNAPVPSRELMNSLVKLAKENGCPNVRVAGV